MFTRQNQPQSYIEREYEGRTITAPLNQRGRKLSPEAQKSADEDYDLRQMIRADEFEKDKKSFERAFDQPFQEQRLNEEIEQTDQKRQDFISALNNYKNQRQARQDREDAILDRAIRMKESRDIGKCFDERFDREMDSYLQDEELEGEIARTDNERQKLV